MGLGFLGIRQRRAWITRLGVLPECRCDGIGGLIVNNLCHTAIKIGAKEIWLEMIVGNAPAQKLFSRKGFVRKKTLVVANRSSSLQEDYGTASPTTEIESIKRDRILRLLEGRTGQPNWRIDSETYHKLLNLHGFAIERADGSQGWICFNLSNHRLDHVFFDTIQGDPAIVAKALLREIISRHPDKDVSLENIDADHPLCNEFSELGFHVAFKRVEMVKALGDARTGEHATH